MMTTELLAFYSSIGWKLFPCFSDHPDPKKVKGPMTTHGYQDATADIRRLSEWFRQHPGCAWGTPTSAAAGVFEYDQRHDPDGKLWAEHVEGKPLPGTWKSVSGGGSPHLWFRWPNGTRSAERCGNAFGRKADGGYVIIPPSKIATHDHAYRWEVRPWERGISEAPDWLVKLFDRPEVKNLKSADENPWVVKAAHPDLLAHPGADKAKGEQRRPVLCELVGVHLARGDNPATIEALVRGWAERCRPPLEEADWRPHLERLTAKEERKGYRMTPHTSPVDITEINPGRKEESLHSESDKLSYLFPRLEAENKSPPEGDAGVSADEPTDFPRLPEAAYYGLFGEMLRAVEPETEADSAAVLLGWLTCFGNIVGRGAWMTVGAGCHYPALFVGIVGKTSDAKGDAWKVSRYPFAEAEPDWWKTCICPGVGSGEGLVERIADEQKMMVLNKRTGVAEEQVIPGATDKRCLLRLGELSRLFKSQRRENNPLSEILREAWDGEPVSIPNRKANALASTGYAVSVVGDITPGAVRKILTTGTEAFDGFANRFLWAAVKSDADLDEGGDIGVLHPFFGRLQAALAFAKTAGELKRDAEAAALWKSIYGDLKRSGDTVPHTDRARPYVVRLSLLYALGEMSAVIRRSHLEAALAVWDYCRESARLIFGTPENKSPDPLWLDVLNLITDNPGIPQADITKKFQRKANAERLGEVLMELSAKGLAFFREETTGGRKVKRWWPGGPDDTGRTHTGKEVSKPGDEDACESAGKEGSKFVVSEIDHDDVMRDKLTYLFPAGGANEDTSFLPADADVKVSDVVSSETPAAERGLL